MADCFSAVLIATNSSIDHSPRSIVAGKYIHFCLFLTNSDTCYVLQGMPMRVFFLMQLRFFWIKVKSITASEAKKVAVTLL